jgi:TonB family protein
LFPGQRLFGRYLLEGVAGRGGMGVVWRAKDEELGDTVALKFLPEIVAADAVAVDELKEETRRARRLTHPHIVRIYNFERDESMAAVSMEYVDGATLAQRRLAQPGKVYAAETLAPLLIQLCAALDYAHEEAKVVHRDLKPANLLVTDDGQLKVTDFGIARSLSETHTRLTGRAGENSGTLLYMSPQQLTGDRPTAADDIYALGATLYELLCSKSPFYTGDITHQILHKAPVGLAEQRRDLGISAAALPRPWEKTILQCLDKDAAKRPKNGKEILRLLGLSGGIATPAQPAPRAAEPKPLSSLQYPTGGKKWEDLEEPAVSSVHYPNPDLKKKSGPQTWFDFLVILALIGGATVYFLGLTPLPRPWIKEEPVPPADASSDGPAPAVHPPPDQARPSAARPENITPPGAIPVPTDATASSKIPAGPARNVTSPASSPSAVLPAENRVVPPPPESTPATTPANPQAGAVRLTAVPESARAVLDDSLVSFALPLSLSRVEPGRHVLTLFAPGFLEKKIEFTVERGQTLDLGTVPMVAGLGSVMIDSQPSFVQFELKSETGKVYRGVTPWDDNKLPIGLYQLTFVRPGNSSADKKITIEHQALLRVMADFSGGLVSITTRSSAVAQPKPAATAATTATTAITYSPPKTGRLRLDVAGPGEYQLLVNDRLTGLSSGEGDGIELPANAEMNLELRATGYQTATRKLKLAAGESEVWKVTLDPVPRPEWNIAAPVGQKPLPNPASSTRTEPQVETNKPVTPPVVAATPTGVMQKPRLLESVQPAYPTSVRARHIQGTVSVRFTVLSTGRVSNIEEISSPDPQLTKSVKEAVTQFRFDPAKIDGRPVPQEVTLEFDFRL